MFLLDNTYNSKDDHNREETYLQILFSVFAILAKITSDVVVPGVTVYCIACVVAELVEDLAVFLFFLFFAFCLSEELMLVLTSKYH